MLHSTTALVCGFATLVHGHMILKTPTPFKPIASVPSFNGPLNADGSDFPCRNPTGKYTLAGEPTKYALGSSQPFQFIGSAVHGGGSCQVAITYDESPTKQSVFKVIHSIHGGCPARNAVGNLGGGAEVLNADIYNFSVPTNIPSGKVTLSITWFNKVGNREMYMYCSPVEITGSGGDKANFDKLPDMFVANVGNGCETVEPSDVLFPNPGVSVEELGLKGAFKAPTGKCGAAGAGGGAGSGSGSSSAAPPKPTTSAGGSSSTIPGGVFVTVKPSSGSGGASPISSAKPSGGNGGVSTSTASSAPAATPTTGAGTGSGAGDSGSAKAVGAACSSEGEWVCLGKNYQRCASGKYTAIQPLAAGTTCQGGGADIKITAGKTKRRAVRFQA